MNVCFSLWGGPYFPIFPIWKRFSVQFKKEYHCLETPEEYYTGLIANYDSDYIVTEPGYEVEFVNKIRGDRKVISLSELKDSIALGETRFGIGMDQILSTVKEKEFKFVREDNTRLLRPIFKKGDIFCSVLLGNVSDPNAIAFFESNQFAISKNATISNLFEYYDERFWPPRKICEYNLQSFCNPFWSKANVLYVLDHKRLNDLINYWNLRALGWEILAIPIDRFGDNFFKKLTLNQFERIQSAGSVLDEITVLKGYGVSKKRFEEFEDGLSTLLDENKIRSDHNFSFQWWFPRIWGQGESLRYDRAASTNVFSVQKTDFIQIDSPKISLAAIESPFVPKSLRHNDPIYKIQISHSYKDYEGYFAEVLPELKSIDLELITRGSGFNQWRYSERGAFYLMNSRDQTLTTYFPEAFRVFEQFFKKHGYGLKRSSTGNLGVGLLKNMGGILGINLLMSKEALALVALFENGRVVGKNELFGKITQHKTALRIDEAKNFVKSLLSKKIVEFGCQIQCEVCNQRSFYSVREVKSILTCQVCRNSFNLPDHDPDSIKWAYRGLGPFSRNNKADGLLCVFLVLRFFKISLASTIGAITPLQNFELTKPNEPDKEVDLALFYKTVKGSLGKPDLIFCECKTNDDFEEKDIDRIKAMASSFPGSILVFATLKDQLNKNERNLITKLAERFRKGISERPSNPVLILTRNELTERFGEKAIEKLNPIPHMQFKDQLGHLADLTCQKYLGIESFDSIVSKRIQKLQEKGKNRQASIG